MKFETIKERVRYIPIVFSSIVTFAGLFAPSNVDHIQIAFIFSGLRHALPECVAMLAVSLLVLFLPNTLISYIQSARSAWRSAFSAIVFDEKYKKIATIAPLLVIFISLLGSTYFLKNYARARYAYWFKDGLQREFQVEQLRQAYQYEEKYEYDRAIRKYSDISEKFPLSKNTALLNERISLNKGLSSYAEHMYEIGKQNESQTGISRPTLELYLEALRVNPRHVEARRRLTNFQKEIRNKITTVTPKIEDCQRGIDTISNGKTTVAFEMITFLTDLPISAFPKGTNLRQLVPPNLCAYVQRFTSATAFLESVRKSWQLDRLDATMKYSSDVLEGKTMSDLLGEDKLNVIDMFQISTLMLPLPNSREEGAIKIPLVEQPIPVH